MALVPVSGATTKQVALSTSYLGAGNEVQITGGSYVELWIDDAAIAFTLSFTVPGQNTIETKQITAGDSWNFHKSQGTVLLVDAKSASGTPKLNVQVM